MTGHRDLSEQIITAAMTRTIDTDLAETLIELHTLVTRHICCPVTGRVLDSRTAHLLTVTGLQGQTASVAVAPDADPQTITNRLAELDLTVSDRFDPADAWATITGRPTSTPSDGTARS
jgi:hypothetical protein